MAEKLDLGNMTDEEYVVYGKAHKKSKGDKKADAQNAVLAHRKDKAGEMKAVEKGITLGGVAKSIKARDKKIRDAG